MMFTPNKFEYNRNNIPFFFVQDKKQICFKKSTNKFYSAIRRNENVTNESILPNGMTFGEMSIHLINKN